jgi:hypothetical protein
MVIELDFSQHLGESPKALEDYWAFDIDLASDRAHFFDKYPLFRGEKLDCLQLNRPVGARRKANGKRASVAEIVCFSASEVAGDGRIFNKRDLYGDNSIVVVDAHHKSSGSKA